MMLRLYRFLSMPWAEQGRIAEAILCLLAVRLVFGIVPFARGLQLLGVAQGEVKNGLIIVSDAREVSRAIARAARHAPFRAVCLQQAFAALLMLRRRGLAATVHLGVARDAVSGDLAGHAWSRCGDVPVTGVAAARGFAPLVAFAA